MRSFLAEYCLYGVEKSHERIEVDNSLDSIGEHISLYLFHFIPISYGRLAPSFVMILNTTPKVSSSTSQFQPSKPNLFSI